MNHLAPGEWVAAYPGREAVGYHLTKLFSPVANLFEIVTGLITTDETKRREAYNQDLGEPYTPRGGQMTDEVLDGCRRDCGHGPAPGETTTMGVDVGKVLHVVIRGRIQPETGERPQRFAGEVESWDELGRLMRRFQVGRCVIDALPETTKAREFQAGQPPGRVWLAYYIDQGTKRTEPRHWDEENGVVNLARTRSLDAMFSRLYDSLNTLPAHARDIKDYYDQLKAPVRVLESKPNGDTVARYVESGSDHLAHAENYCEAAAHAPDLSPASASRSVNLREKFS